MLTKAELLQPLAEHRRQNDVVVTTMGVVCPWERLSQSALDFASADSAMGHAADLALGIAMARPDRRVICLNGDGSMLMSRGTLATIVESGATNLILMVVENRAYEITGGQPVPGGGKLDFAAVARACGFPSVFAFVQAEAYDAALPSLLTASGPVFVSVSVEAGNEGPIARGPGEEAIYLRTSIAEWAVRFRMALANS